MKKLPLLIATLLIAFGTVLGQRTDYSIDNFDFRNGVKAVEPVAVQSASPRAGRVRKSGSKEALAAKNNSLSTAASSLLVVPTVLTSGLSVSGSVVNADALRGYTTGSGEIDGYLIKSGTNNGVDPLLLYSVMHQESSFKSRAISPRHDISAIHASGEFAGCSITRLISSCVVFGPLT